MSHGEVWEDPGERIAEGVGEGDMALVFAFAFRVSAGEGVRASKGLGILSRLKEVVGDWLDLLKTEVS